MITRIVTIIAFILIWLAPGMLLSAIIDQISIACYKKKIKREIENPVKSYGLAGVKVKKDLHGGHRDIGGKIGYIDRTPTVEEILIKALNYNPGCLNFVHNRTDLFEDFKDYEIRDSYLIKPKAYNLKYFYIKIREHDQFIGYIVASDEIEEYINCKEEDYGNN